MSLFLALALGGAADGDVKGLESFLQKYCVDCHGADKPKKGVRLDVAPATPDAWADVFDRIRFGEMPPRKSEQPTAAELKAALAAIAAKADAGRTDRQVLRRLNRAEYQNTIRDLLNVELPLAELLPPDASSHGFDNVGEALHSSSFLMERYLQAADLALDAAYGRGPKTWLLKKRFDLKNEGTVKPKGDVYRHLHDAVAIFSSQENANIQVCLWSLRTHFAGRYKIRVSAYAVQTDRPVTFKIKEGSTIDVADNRILGYFDVPPTPTVIEIEERLEASKTLRFAVDGMAMPRDIHKAGGVEAWKGPGLAIQWIEIEGPLPTSPTPPGDLRAFARRAFRRPVSAEEVAALKTPKAILMSPDFLFLREAPGPLDELALASRLSYFLWSSTPDEELLALAEKGQLRASLEAQVERLLNDPKAAAFTENFVGQWLDLRKIDDTVPDPALYPEYSDDLKTSMLREPYLYWDALLKENASLAKLVASDFSVLNGPLASLYGIPGVEGREFRRVSLPPDSRRGGVLTMAAVLKVTANGTNTSPILRGAWVLERVLGTPPPKPSVDVEAIEPDIRGTTTIRQQLAKHRERPECASCHRRIDPPGFALESFDVMGAYRDYYRSVGKGEWVRGKPYKKGPPVDATDELVDGRRFSNVDEFKKLLAADPDALARSLAEKLLTYATGAAPRRGDWAEVDALVARIKAKNYGLRTLVHEIVKSPLFGRK
jgi:hypothetical protein